jgi:hypothetical protein
MDKYSERYASDLRELNWRRAGYRFIGSTPTHDIVFSLLSHSTLIYPRVDGVDALVVSGRHRKLPPSSDLTRGMVYVPEQNIYIGG